MLGVYAVVVLRVLFLFVHNSLLVCGLSSLRILHTQTDCMPHPIFPVTNLIQENVTSPPDMATAIVDRTVHHGRMIRFEGESYRRTHALMG